MALQRRSTDGFKPIRMQMQFDQTCMSLLVMACECPVCHAVVKPPTKMCLNGHICCMACVLDKPSCPDCQERFSCTRNSVVERMLKIVGCACPHARFGCLEFLAPSARTDHERYCGWRRVQCLWCSATPGINQWAEHVVERHGPHALTYDSQGDVNIPLGTDVEKSLFYLNGVMFCIYFTRGENDGPLYITFQCFPTSKEELNTVFEAFVENKGLYLCQSIRPISDAVKRSDVFKNLNECIVIPPYLLKQKESISFKIIMPNDFKKTLFTVAKLSQYQKNKLSL